MSIQDSGDRIRDSGAGIPGETTAALSLNPQPSTLNPCFILLAAYGLLCLYLALRFPLHPDETYYWEWSRRPARGYYDQGPMIAWWIRASCGLFGDTPLGVRFGIVVAALATQGFLCLLARDLFGPRAAFCAVLSLCVTPLALAGGFIATYDPLIALFWAAAMYFAARAVLFGSRAAWIGVGLAFGLGLLSKHTMVMFAPCLLLFLAVRPEQRRWLVRPEPYMALFLALAVFAPNLWWQYQHEWMTFRHLFLLTGKGTDQPFLRRLGDFLGSQAGVLTPLLFLGFVSALAWAVRRWRDPERPCVAYLFAMSAPVLLFFLLLTLKSKVQANWAVTGWLAPPLLLAAWLEEAKSRKAQGASGESLTQGRKDAEGEEETGFRGQDSGGSRAASPLLFFRVAVGMALLLAALLIWPEARRPLGLVLPRKADPARQMDKLYGGVEIGAAADRVRRAMESEDAGPIAVGAATYDNASRLAFYMSGQPRTCCFFLGTRLNSYVLWNSRTRPRPGGNALVVDDLPPDDPAFPPYRAVFERVVPVPEPVRVYRRGLYAEDEPIRTYHLYRCYGYRPNRTAETSEGG